MRFGRRIWWAALGLRWRIRGAHAAPQRSLALDVRGCAQDQRGRRVAPAFRAKRVCGIRLRDARATRRAGPAAMTTRTPVTGRSLRVGLSVGLKALSLPSARGVRERTAD